MDHIFWTTLALGGGVLFVSNDITIRISCSVDMKKILELDSSNIQASRGIQRLEPLAAENREKMKEEMIGMFQAWLYHT